MVDYLSILMLARVDGELTEWFKVTLGVRQGCGLTPYLFVETDVQAGL